MKMSIKRMFKSKKAISPILATLLLIVIAVAAIVVTYAWITTYMGTTTQQAGFIPYKANVAFNTGGTNGTVTIDVGNSGTSTGQIVGIYIGTSASALASQTSVSPTLPEPVGAGGIVSFVVTHGWTTGTTYYFKVVPSSGAALSFSETA
jgi:archaeal type IV pilus assembly protein PilA